jgi:pimeloyl-ACP methyl ester carboxylesterase
VAAAAVQRFAPCGRAYRVGMQSLRVRGEDIPITTFGALGARPLLFLHGYARHPLDYRLALAEVARRGWRVVAPFLFANHRLRRPPTSFWACAALGRRTHEALLAAGLVGRDTPVFGHSTGGAVALTLGAAPAPPPRILAVNPVQPAERHVMSFVLRSGWMNTKLALGVAGDGRLGRQVLRESGVRFYVNWLRDPCRGLALIEGLTRYSYPRVDRWFGGAPNTDSSARVLFGAGDEFYPESEGLEAGLGRVFTRFDVRRLTDESSHEWLMIRPARLADEVQSFCGA